MRKRLLYAAAALTTLGALLPSGTAAAEPDQRFERLPDAYNHTGAVPAALDPAQQVKVMVQVSGDPVAAAEADAADAGRTIDKASARRELKATQQDGKQAVEALGGTVTATYTDAFNGFAATVPADKIDELAKASGVVDVHRARTFVADNAAGGSYIGADKVWQYLGKTGKGIKVGVIDSGVDYLHADFGGSGVAADFAANDKTVIEPGSFPTAKVVGGYDFVGDAYDAGSSDPAKYVPKPDPDPLDCGGHGSHVAGTIAGQGVTTDGKTYTGPYDGSTYAKGFTVAPGVAPEASLLAYRIFGCSGSSTEDVIVTAMEQALKDGVDVVNMSLGSPFGREDEPSAQAVRTLTRAGVTVVASAGNSGPNAYITGAPAVATTAISVAAMDVAMAQFPAATLTSGSGVLTLINANNAPVSAGSLPVAVLRTSYPNGPLSLGCTPADYAAYPGGVAGKLVVTLRGSCARVKRAILGQQAGAAAVAMINTSAGYPVFEGQITSDPDTGVPYTVTIPFLGFQLADRAAAAALDGQSVALAATTMVNPAYGKQSLFSSGGPGNVESMAKPDVTAPGDSVVSVGVGTGNGPSTKSGTSMAAPMTAGVAALVTQAHPRWKPGQVKAAIVSTAGAEGRHRDYNARIAGSGVVDAKAAVETNVFASTRGNGGNLSFKYAVIGNDGWSATQPVEIANKGESTVTYDLAAAFNGDARGATVAVQPSKVTVRKGSSVTVQVTLSISAAAAAALPAAEASNFGALTTVQGAVTATPRQAAPGAGPLRVAFLAVPDAVSKVTAGRAKIDGDAVSVELRNTGVHAGTADVFALGVTDPDDVTGAEDSMDIRATGVQVLPGEVLGGSAEDRTLVFAVSTHGRWSSAAANEFDVAVDTGNDGTTDYFVVGADYGAMTTGSFDGRMASFVYTAAGRLVGAWVATAPANSGTVLLPAPASALGISAAKPSFSYGVSAFSQVPDDLLDQTGVAAFDAYNPAVSTGGTVSVAPGATASLSLTRNPAAAQAPGWMVVTLDDRAGVQEADLVTLR
ncbi:S8 family serine peptidase [Nonomuraea africana]|uniref:Subtilisin family serine protease n=1 Tax=Nonomuraea africana TaxID=46171 RepID=A0ABR9KRW7_9ACTN|nr:S8 family serine peptidase [Nonomuraea africana]MBE1564781.1 subtilisin family serine protease [Nonomuraea africana]